MVDATVIGSLSSTNNADKARIPELRQTRKGQQWYFGTRLPIGVGSQTALTQSAVVTAANVHDKHPLPDLTAWARNARVRQLSLCQSKKLTEDKAFRAKDFINQRTRRSGIVEEALKAKNRNKSRIRSLVEHVFGLAKRLWGFEALEKCAAGAWPKTSRARPLPWRWRTSTLVDQCRWHRCAREGCTGPKGFKNRPYGPQKKRLATCFNPIALCQTAPVIWPRLLRLALTYFSVAKSPLSVSAMVMASCASLTCQTCDRR